MNRRTANEQLFAWSGFLISSLFIIGVAFSSLR